jgi:tetratricopeptide (TPR) repeat protein
MCQNDAEFLESQGLGREPFIEAAGSFANFYQDQGRFMKAAHLYERTLAWNKTCAVFQASLIFTTRDSLGTVYWELGRYEDAIKQYTQSTGPDHPSTAETRNNLGGLLWRQGHLEAFIDEFDQALAIWEKILGRERPCTAERMNNRGLVYRDLARYTEAVEQFNRA